MFITLTPVCYSVYNTSDDKYFKNEKDTGIAIPKMKETRQGIQ